MARKYLKEVQSILSLIREALSNRQPLRFENSYEIESLFDKECSITYVTLFQEGIQPIRFGSKQASLEQTLNRVVSRLLQNPRLIEFDVLNSSRCRILFEMATKEYPCNIRNLTTMRMHSPNRFEPGVNGLKYKYENQTRFFMPTDAYTKSIMSVNQLLNHLSKQCGIAKRTNKISERVHLMRREPIEYTFLESIAYVSFEDEVLFLQRGYPYPIEFNETIVYDKIIKSANWLVNNMNEDGSFLYYYDPYKDTVVDDMHPNMINPLYNNILRHSGGTISLLRAYELSSEKLYLQKAKDSIDFLLSTFQEHTYNNEYACYPFFNKKSKLGGAGIGLVAIMHYYIQTQDKSLRKYMDGLVRHILSRVDDEGELIGYYLHPKFNDGKPLINPNDEVKKELFSFYYPGEALLGLALYYLHVPDIDISLKEDLLLKSEKALDFLVDIRPVKYDYMFESLPADAWLMQAIEEWVKVVGFKKQSYIDFVFNDTKQMFEHMYTYENVYEINKDYVGGFYYNYGDHVYHDASRCEGIVSAYYLAKYLEDEDKAQWIKKHMQLSAKGLMQTFHDEQSTYAHIYPQKAMHSFRFKLTRQWVRVDSVQHAACFLSRFYPVMQETDTEYIAGFEVKKSLGKGGFGEVYLTQKDERQYALKLIHHPRYINRIEQEIQALTLLNQFDKNKVEFIGHQQLHPDVFLLFDYASQGNLKRHIKKHGVFGEKEALAFVQRMVEILTFTQQHNLLHLDIKPANILLHDETYWLADWGLSQFSQDVKTLHLKGNPIYLAPEMYKGHRDFASEIYALGCTLYFVMTGKNPYNLDNNMDDALKMYCHSYYDLDLSFLTSNKIEYLLSRMLQKEPSKRATLEEMQTILDSSDVFKIEQNNSDEVPFDKENIVLYEKMANDGIAYAQNNLARFSQEKKDNKSLQEAKHWFEKASLQGLAGAQCNLALIYFKEEVFEKAFELFEQAALQGYDKAQYYLAHMYEEGMGVKAHQDEALKWYKESARNGYRKAYKKLDAFKESVSIQEM